MTTIRVVDSLDDARRDEVHRLLRDHDRAASPAFWAAMDDPAHAARPLCVVALDDAGGVVGGLIAETRLKWLEISIMAVREDARRTGVGRRLVAVAEETALARGCRRVHVDTMDYRAPAFYERLGYSVAGRLEDWDSHGHAKLFFVKRLF